MIVEKVLYDFLNSKLNTEENGNIPAFMEKPVNAPDTFVLIEKTGGGVDNCIEKATFAIQSISTSLYKTAQLNELVKATMLKFTAETPVMHCKLNSDYNFTREDLKEYRYQAVYNMNY